MRRKVISTHYLRRRAEARAEAVRQLQRRAERFGNGAQAVVHELGIDGHKITTRRRGKWDARYDVIATPREEAS